MTSTWKIVMAVSWALWALLLVVVLTLVFRLNEKSDQVKELQDKVVKLEWKVEFETHLADEWQQTSQRWQDIANHRNAH